MFKKQFALILLMFTYTALFSFNNANGDFRARQSGYWHDTSVWEIYKNKSWHETKKGEVPTSLNNVTIPENFQIIIAGSNLQCKNIEVFGALVFGSVDHSMTMYKLTVNGDVNIAYGGVVKREGLYGTSAVLVLENNIVNNGELLTIFNTYNNKLTFLDLKFSKNEKSIISGTGLYDLNKVTISKDSKSDVVEFRVALSNMKRLSLEKGTLLISEAIEQQVFSNDGNIDVINGNSIVVVDNVGARVSFPDKLQISGELKCINGEVTIGDNSDEGVNIDNWGAGLFVDKGALSVSGSFNLVMGDVEVKKDGEIDVQSFGTQENNQSLYVGAGSSMSLDGTLRVINGSYKETVYIDDNSSFVINKKGEFIIENNSNLDELKFELNTDISEINFNLGQNSDLKFVNSKIALENIVKGIFANIEIENTSLKLTPNAADKLYLKSDSYSEVIIKSYSNKKYTINNLFSESTQEIGGVKVDAPNITLVISNDLKIKNDYKSGDLEVLSGNIRIRNNSNLTSDGAIKNIGGNINFENGSSFYQTNENSNNIGDVVIERDEIVNESNYNYWSSPINKVTFKPSDVWHFGSENNEYDAGGLLELLGIWTDIDKDDYISNGKGFVVPGPNQSKTGTLYFEGDLNNGDVNTSLVYNTTGYNLVGNPYPSSIDYTNFIDDNKNTIEQSVYMWNHKPGQDTYSLISAGLIGAVPFGSLEDNQISTSQGFIVKLKDDMGSSVKFHNSQRLTPSESISKKTEVDGYKLWLSIKHNEEEGQMLIASLSGASNITDIYDVAKVPTENILSISSTVEEKNYTINAINIEVDNHTIPLSIEVEESGLYVISKVNLINEEIDLVATLHDNYSNKTVDILENSYEFNVSEIGVLSDRFEIIISHKGQLSNKENDFKDEDITIKVENNVLFVISENKKLSRINAISIEGRVNNLHGSNSDNVNSYDISALSKGIYIINVIDEDGQSVNKKINI